MTKRELQETDKWNEIILAAFAREGIQARHVDKGFLAVNRTSCHCAPMFKHMHEWDIIKALPPFIRNEIGVNQPSYITMAGKTDDDWYIELYEKVGE